MKLKYVLMLSVFFAAITLLSSCYQMPKDGEYSVVPATNNPSVVGGDRAPNWMPGGGF